MDQYESINIKLDTFLSCFKKSNELSNAKRMPLNIFDATGQLVGTFYSPSAFKELNKQINGMKDEITCLQQRSRS